MVIFLKDKETGEILDRFENILKWNINFVEYKIRENSKCKIYCEENQYFTDIGEEND